jgi:uncharacterized membrane protein
MLSFELVLKFIHILSAITAVGLNISYGIWIVRAQRDPSHMGFALKGIKFLDDRVANPAYGLLLVTGLLMVFTGGFRITELWIILALILFAALIALGLFMFTPTLRNQVRLVEAGDTASSEFARLGRRSQILGQGMGVIVVVILVLMVFKPHL